MIHVTKKSLLSVKFDTVTGNLHWEHLKDGSTRIEYILMECEKCSSVQLRPNINWEKYEYLCKTGFTSELNLVVKTGNVLVQ